MSDATTIKAERKVTLYYSAPAPCPYLSGRTERRIFTEMHGPAAQSVYDQLTLVGFRRSLRYAYRPACPGCGACVPVRIPVAEFAWTRRWRRVRTINQDLALRMRPANATAEQYRLFARYQRGRHADGDMARMDDTDYRAMVELGALDSRMYELRDEATGQLVAACLVDSLATGLSAVYSFYDPDHRRRSLGSLIILTLVEQAVASGLPFVYLGYWIADSPKMAYKAEFAPLEALSRDGWRRITAPRS